MLVEIQLFAVLKEELGETVTLDLRDPVTVDSMKEAFAQAYPQFRSAMNSLSVAVDQTYSTGSQPIKPGQEVAMFPPVSGG